LPLRSGPSARKQQIRFMDVRQAIRAAVWTLVLAASQVTRSK
jgi:hypothetical protein